MGWATYVQFKPTHSIQCWSGVQSNSYITLSALTDSKSETTNSVVKPHLTVSPFLIVVVSHDRWVFPGQNNEAVKSS
jgi:hypothetical protein